MTLEHHPSRRWLRPVTLLGLFVVALTAWTFYLTQAELAVFNDPEGNAMQKWTTWLGVPLAGVLTIVLAHWSLSASAATPAEQPPAPPATVPAPKTYVLEVIGLGVSLDKHRQGKLWDALQQGHPFGTIREQDPEKYPWSELDKDGAEGNALASTVENGIRGLPMYWPAPSFAIGNSIESPRQPSSEFDPVIGGPVRQFAGHKVRPTRQPHVAHPFAHFDPGQRAALIRRGQFRQERIGQEFGQIRGQGRGGVRGGGAERGGDDCGMAKAAHRQVPCWQGSIGA